jgi:A/G-specific adenine glycosylase
MEAFLGEIYNWFKKNKRDLPWRQTTDPYSIWLSEIILQQTRVVQGTKYYLRFLEKFPSVKILAGATEDEVLKVWQGLGYYSRARNLHVTAKYIQNECNGVFPANFNDIVKLKGIGPYTAAAIASIAFDLSYPAIDGNVFRVFSRYFGILTPIDSDKGKKEIQQIAHELMPQKNAGFHNQALMEFGALQCVPKSPDCGNCVLRKTCYAAQNKRVDDLPVKSKKIKQKARYFYYYYMESGGSTFIEKREKNDIWRNLYQFPLLESQKQLTEKEILENATFYVNNENSIIKKLSDQKKHVLSHQVIFARLVSVEILKPESLEGKFIQVNKKDIFKFAVPRLIEEFIKDLNLNEKND